MSKARVRAPGSLIRAFLEEVDTPVSGAELRVIVKLMESMYDALHEDPPSCCGEPAHLFVELANGKELDITQDVPHVCAALKRRLAASGDWEEEAAALLLSLCYRTQVGDT